MWSGTGPQFVGIGASAGALHALERFFSLAPADSGLVFVVVQHLDRAERCECSPKRNNSPLAKGRRRVRNCLGSPTWVRYPLCDG
ncbi:MAG: chemotaxis protein CheB, partial [Polyangia bacterium]